MNAVTVDVSSDIARVRLNRPDDANALDVELALQLRDAAAEWVAARAKVVVLSAEGRFFCAGGDVRAMASGGEAYVRELADTLHDALRAMAASSAIVIAAVQGPAAGAGLALALNADLVVATEQATFTAAYSALGVTPDGGTTYLLPRIVGIRRSVELTLGGRRLSAQEAAEWGIVNRVVDAGGLEREVDEWAEKIARTPAAAIAGTKRLLGAGHLEAFSARLDDEAASISRLVSSEESIDLQQRFLARSAR